MSNPNPRVTLIEVTLIHKITLIPCLPKKSNLKTKMKSKQIQKDFHEIDNQKVLKKLNSSQNGLLKTNALKLLETIGRNKLPENQKTSLLKLVIDQFKDQLVIILLLAATVSFILASIEGDPEGFVEPIVILLILIANAVVGVVQEQGAEESIQALKKYSPDNCVCIREGNAEVIDATELVPGILD